MKARCDREVRLFLIGIFSFFSPPIRHHFFKTEFLKVVVQSKEDKKISYVWLLCTSGIKESSSGPCN